MEDKATVCVWCVSCRLLYIEFRCFGKRLGDSRVPILSTQLAKLHKAYCDNLCSPIHYPPSSSSSCAPSSVPLMRVMKFHLIPPPHTLNGSPSEDVPPSASVRSFAEVQNPLIENARLAKGPPLPSLPPLSSLAPCSDSEEGVIAIPFRNPSKVAYLPSLLCALQNRGPASSSSSRSSCVC